MTIYLRLNRYLKYYLVGLLFHLILLSVLYSGESSFFNLQIPEGKFQQNIWASCSDVMSYVRPARNFAEYGVVGYKYNPDHFRTIGYPVFLGTLMILEGNNWLIILIVIQAIVFAFFYPLILLLYDILFPEVKGQKWLFLFLLVTGVYMVRLAQVLTDTMFCLLLIAGVYYGLKFYLLSQKRMALLYILFITLASLVRPTLSLFFIVNLFIAWIAIASKQWIESSQSIKRALFISLIFLFVCNISTFRNVINYKFYSPSSVVSLNLFEYLGKRVLIANNDQKTYYKLHDSISSLKNINDIDKARKAASFAIVKKYPIAAAKEVFFKNSINLLLSNHYENIANYYGYSWKPAAIDSPCYPYRDNKFMYYLSYFMMFIYAVVFIGFLLALIDLIRQRRFALLFFLLLLFGLFIIPGMITGSGGARFRLPFEGFMLIIVNQYFMRIYHNYKKGIKKFGI